MYYYFHFFHQLKTDPIIRLGRKTALFMSRPSHLSGDVDPFLLHLLARLPSLLEAFFDTAVSSCMVLRTSLISYKPSCWREYKWLQKESETRYMTSSKDYVILSPCQIYCSVGVSHVDYLTLPVSIPFRYAISPNILTSFPNSNTLRLVDRVLYPSLPHSTQS
jgi:hypothetical protein